MSEITCVFKKKINQILSPIAYILLFYSKKKYYVIIFFSTLNNFIFLKNWGQILKQMQ